MRRGFLKYSLLLFLLLQALSTATIRYVSKTGTSTPPYLSWITASDSIQKAINICSDGDTVVVGNGVYRETLIIYQAITLIGTSMDSTVIDARDLLPHYTTIEIYNDCTIKNFHVYGTSYPSVIIMVENISKIFLYNLALEHSTLAIHTGDAYFALIENCIITDCMSAIFTGGIDTSSYFFRNNLIITRATTEGIYQHNPSLLYLSNNIILKSSGSQNSGPGVLILRAIKNYIRNNVIAGFTDTQLRVYYVQDSAFIYNNVLGYTGRNIYPVINVTKNGEKILIRNNIIVSGFTGITCLNDNIYPDYNLYWNLAEKYGSTVIPGEHEISANPMFINDTLPTGNLSFDFHLQKYSPSIDAGDPEILDVDGSRSDIGMYGGPFGEKYAYEDFAPKTPKGLTAVVDTSDIKLKWKKNTEADFFKYRLFSDTIAGFTADSTTLLSELTDTIFTHPINQKPLRVYYKIAAIDSQGNQSALSSEIGVVISSVEEEKPGIIQEYELYQNYPNPFNPQTRIPYRLKEGGMVRIVIYDITGQKVATLVNEYKEAGYHEEEFKITSHNDKPFNNQLDELVSGIYLYRIEVTGKGNIPVYSEMRKMVILK